MSVSSTPNLTFIDLFAGCGGLSLGLLQAGWKGLFAIEKSRDAFSTFQHNLVGGKFHSFHWPDWLKIAPMSVQDLLKQHGKELRSLQETVDLLAGGPPCQGYSFAGRRNPSDPRNKLYLEYLEVVKLVQPRFLLFENVRGFTTGFSTMDNSGKKLRTESHSEVVAQELKGLGYEVFSEALISSDAGVPQPRCRFVLLAIKKGDAILKTMGEDNFFNIFKELVPLFRKNKGLPMQGDITASMALSDLETKGKASIACVDSSVPGFKQIRYKVPKLLSAYQAYLRKDMPSDEAPDSMRLVNHHAKTRNRFKEILKTCQPGQNISSADRVRLNIKKHSIIPLAADKLAATVTTLPDDFIHYSEPRVLTVREMARLQSFPDWFSFQGAYTTGGKDRRNKCPRYTQVGNAVPPLLAEALGKTLLNLTLENYD